MVYRIIAYSHGCTVKRIYRVVRLGYVVECKTRQAMDTARLAMIWHHRQQIFCGVFVIGKTEIIHAQLVLEEIDISQCLSLCFLKRLRALFGSHLDKIDINIIAGYGPVDHIFAVRQLAISHHP